MNKYVIVLLFLLSSCSAKHNSVKDLPKVIRATFSIDLVSNENDAKGIAKIIMSRKSPKIDFENVKYIISSVADDKVWEIEVIVSRSGATGFDKTIFMRINKNNGEILNFWEVK